VLCARNRDAGQRGAVRGLLRVLVGALALLGALAAAGALAFAWSGISARPEPSALEARAARAARRFLIRASARGTTNPLPADREVLARAKEHFLDHCAPCHGRDGRGDTSLGRGLSPRVPDMTVAATQELSDAELFWIIENGVRLTGMPAWGDASPDDDAHAWALVHWIRRLPVLTAEDLEPPKCGGATPPAHDHRTHTHERK
jgi:mono/diheme cytochrome c family protein